MTSIVEQLETNLKAALAQRSDHLNLIGLDVRQVPAGNKFVWRDALTHNEGFLCVCSEAQIINVTEFAMRLIADLRCTCRDQLPVVPKAKQRKSMRPLLPKAVLRDRKLDRRIEDIWHRRGRAA